MMKGLGKSTWKECEKIEKVRKELGKGEKIVRKE